MKIIQIKESERIQEGLRSLTEFMEEYPYYSTWIQKNEATFKDGTRVVYELKDNNRVYQICRNFINNLSKNVKFYKIM